MTDLDEHAADLAGRDGQRWIELTENQRDVYRGATKQEAGFPGYNFVGAKMELSGHDDF